jgi:hypothetical protein
MLKKFLSYLGLSRQKPDFTTFFNTASSEEKRKMLLKAAKKANGEQKKVYDEYLRTKQKTA